MMHLEHLISCAAADVYCCSGLFWELPFQDAVYHNICPATLMVITLPVNFCCCHHCLGSDVNGSIMLTASHMPMQNNGMKFFTAEGGLGKADITAILDNAAHKCFAAGLGLGHPLQDTGFVLHQAVKTSATPGTWKLLEKYAGHLREQIIQGIKQPQHPDRPLQGLKIAVDAGNGSGGFFATQASTWCRSTAWLQQRQPAKFCVAQGYMEHPQYHCPGQHLSHHLQWQVTCYRTSAWLLSIQA
eukprot:GHRR01009242.1.p1 GENE.GHRR01009242.1~~GHRR01009242.1.p1  ORF type:complete len:243 (+),score=57.75 GHRR01009242.1:1704-2432(+)